MNALPIVYFLISSLTGLLAVGILLFYNKEQRHANNLLTLTLFALTLTCFNLFLFYSGLIQHIPWFYKISSPINLLVGPALYIYVRASLHGELNFRKYDWLFTIPCVIHGLDMMPFFLMPAEEKQLILQLYLEDPASRMRYGKEGFIPQLVIQIFRSVWSTLFFVLAIHMIYKFKRVLVPSLMDKNKTLIQWLSYISILLFMTTTGMTVLYLLISLNPVSLIFAEYWFGLLVMVIIIGLYARPSVLYGLFLPSSEQVNPQRDQPTTVLQPAEPAGPDLSTGYEMAGTFMDTRRETYRTRIETYMKKQEPFLTPGYGLENLSKEVNIPKNVLSAFINQEYGIGFSHFVNRNRIDFILRNKDNPAWQHITLDGIGQEVGFRSKTTFFNAFKKETGMTPAQYLKQGQDFLQ